MRTSLVASITSTQPGHPPVNKSNEYQQNWGIKRHTAQCISPKSKVLRHKLRRVLMKTSQNCFHHNFVKFPPTWIIFGTEMAKMLKLCKLYCYSTSPNLCQCTTMWNTDAPNCYITWWLFVSDCSSLYINSTEGAMQINNVVVLNILRW